MAVGWQVYEITKNPLWLGLIGLSEAIPFIISTFPGGHFADTRRRKRIMQYTVSGYLVCSLSLLMLNTFASNWISGSGLWAIFAVISLIGVLRGFSSPARAALGYQLIKKDEMLQAASISSTTWQAAFVLGPAIGGVIYGMYDCTSAYLLTCVCTSISLLSYFLIRANPVAASDTTEPALTKVKEGLTFFFNHPIILPAMSLDMLAVLFGGAVAVLPMFCDVILHTGPEGLGILRAMPSVGGILAGFVVTLIPLKKNAGKKLLAGVCLFGLSMVLFALSRNFYLSCALLILSGAADMVSVVIRSTILQTFAPEEMRGRLSAINYIFVGTSNDIGAFESGVAARFLGLIPSVVIGGFSTIFISGVVGIVSKPMRELEFET